MIGIIDYGVGNLASLTYALNDLNIEPKLLSDITELEKCSTLILPGVGHADYAMEQLKAFGLVDFLKTTEQPLVGICLGMQLLYEASDEASQPLLGRIPGRLKKFKFEKLPTIHMGWNSVNEDDVVYFVHSYYAPLNEFTYGKTYYNIPFTSIVKCDNMVGFQFHPEKSSNTGLSMLKNALEGRL